MKHLLKSNTPAQGHQISEVNAKACQKKTKELRDEQLNEDVNK